MADTANAHPTDGRRRKGKGPPSRLALPRLERVSDTEREHSEDSAGEKEAKRQRSNPGTPVSTPRRTPYDYDAVMGITRVGTREAEGFDEDLDSTEYHDANDTTEEPIRKEETETDSQVPMSTGFQGGYGSSSLKECIELLNTTSRIAPAPLDSGVGNSADPPHTHASIGLEPGGCAGVPDGAPGCLPGCPVPDVSEVVVEEVVHCFHVDVHQVDYLQATQVAIF